MGNLSDDALLLAASFAVREDTPFAFSISKKPPRAYADFLGRAMNYINVEASTSKKSGSAKASHSNPEGDRWKEMKRPVEALVGNNWLATRRGNVTQARGQGRPALANRDMTDIKSSQLPSRRFLSIRGAKLTFDHLHL